MTLPRELTALVVDDEFHLRLFLKGALKKIGFKVVAEAGNGAEALEKFRAHRPDVTFLDINMPVMSGRDALLAIRQELPSAVVIMLTSLVSSDEVEACLDAGAVNYLRKDTPLEELQQEIEATCAEHFTSPAN